MAAFLSEYYIPVLGAITLLTVLIAHFSSRLINLIFMLFLIGFSHFLVSKGPQGSYGSLGWSLMLMPLLGIPFLIFFLGFHSKAKQK